MKILVVPDLHENLDFIKYIFAVEDTANFDHIVLLGDYFDPPTEIEPCAKRLQQVAGTLMGYKEIYGDRLHMLCGNHDLPYYALRVAFENHTQMPNPIGAQWTSHASHERAEIINELWDEAFWHQLKGAVLLDGWLFSHAGVHLDLWPQYLDSTESRYRAFQEQWSTAFTNINVDSDHPMFAIGSARGGAASAGGPLWIDWDTEFEDSLEVPQIVGHTRCAKQTQKGRSFCIDFAQAAYAIVEDGQVQLNIWPKSWLGESMLD